MKTECESCINKECCCKGCGATISGAAKYRCQTLNDKGFRDHNYKCDHNIRKIMYVNVE